MACKMKVIKSLMIFFNFIFSILGLALLIIGIWVLNNYGTFFSFSAGKFAKAEILLIVVGAFVMLMGFLGCFGSITENYCLLATFVGFLAIILTVELSAGIIGFVYKNDVQEAAVKALKRATENYSGEPGARKILDKLQQIMTCCGANGPNDYNLTAAGNHTENYCGVTAGAVKSCHKKSDCGGELFKDGCMVKIVKLFKGNLAVIGGAAFGIAFIQLIGILFACCLMKEIKSEYEIMR